MPALTPLTIPVDEPTVALEVLLLLQVPPDVALLSEVVLPAQTTAVPVIAPGTGFTVAVRVVWQPASI